MNLSEARILFVDDEPLLLEIFVQWIGRETVYQVTTAADGQEALEMLATNEYDLLITDVNMPRVNGTELVRRMAAMEKTLPGILFVSGFGIVDQREMYGLGVEAFLAKPVLRDRLLATMQQALAERADLWKRPSMLRRASRLRFLQLTFRKAWASGTSVWDAGASVLTIRVL